MKILFILFVLLLLPSQNVSAEAPSEDTINYSVKAILPDNQVSDVSYFDLEMERGQKQNLEVMIFNSGTEEITVDIKANTAASNSNGVVIYDGSNNDFSDNMENDFSELAEVTESPIVVAPHSEEMAVITISAPEETFDGRILGGLHFSLLTNEDEQQDGIGVRNEYAYAIAVNIVESGNSNEVIPQVELDSAQPQLINHQNGVQTFFTNRTPTLITQLSVTGNIYKQDDLETPLHTKEVSNFAIAPYSKFNFPITFNNHALEQGEYVIQVSMNNDDIAWDFEETFLIEETDDEANIVGVNSIDGNQDVASIASGNDNTFLVYSLIGTILILLVVVVWLFIRLKRK